MPRCGRLPSRPSGRELASACGFLLVTPGAAGSFHLEPQLGPPPGTLLIALDLKIAGPPALLSPKFLLAPLSLKVILRPSPFLLEKRTRPSFRAVLETLQAWEMA